MKSSHDSDFGPSLLITGHAGTGKTTRLVAVLEERLTSTELAPYQAVPVISAMHGARRRLAGRLAELRKSRNSQGLPFQFRVETIDSLALHIANRGRCFIGERRPILPCVDPPPDTHRVRWVRIDECCTCASEVLVHPMAMQMVRDSYPIVVIDEFQDCRGDKLEFVRHLSRAVSIIAAADAFQVISGDGDDAPAVEWAEGAFQVLNLGSDRDSRRTGDPRIRNTAAALRGTSGVPRPRVTVLVVPAGPLAGSKVAYLAKSLRHGDSAALLSYAPKKSYAVQALRVLNEGSKNWQAGKSKLGPVPFAALASQRAELDELVETAKNAIEGESCTPGYSLPSTLPSEVLEAWRSCMRGARRLGRSEWSRTELINEVSSRVHRRHSFAPASFRRVALSIPSAKNQEWDHVFVLWAKEFFPAEHSEGHRVRLLYNAITRARRGCLVLVRASSWAAALRDHPYLAEMDPVTEPASSRPTVTERRV